MNSILHTIRRSRFSKAVSLAMAASFVAEIFYPTVALALTSGPSQPEYGSFTPVETTEMVDLYSGDFSYNIPLLSVPGPNGGYPINLGYTSNIGMDEEASWVGLGWNINVGAVNRNLRGLPDDFNGKTITEEFHIKKDWTIGIDFPQKASTEVFGFAAGGVGPNFGIYYNAYRGIGYNIAYDASFGLGKAGSLGTNFSFDSQGGIDVSPRLSLGATFGKVTTGFNFGASVNSRRGFQGFSFSSSVGVKGDFAYKLGKKGKDGGGIKHIERKLSSGISFSPNYTSPSASMPMINKRFDLDFKFPPRANMTGWATYMYGMLVGANAYYDETKVANGGIVNSEAYGYMHTPEAQDKPDALKDYLRSPAPYSKDVPYLGTSMPTYDLFVISGQGAGGMFRPHLSNIGTLRQAYKKTEQDGHRFNVEVPTQLIPAVYVGAGYSNRSGHTSSGSWRTPGDYDKVTDHLNYSPTAQPTIKEDVYFKGYGDKTADLITTMVGPTEKSQYDLWEGSKPYMPELGKTGNFVGQQFELTGKVGSLELSAQPDLTKRTKDRVSKGTSFRVLSKTQAAAYGFNKDYEITNTDGNPLSVFDICGTGCDDDIYEIQVLQPDGSTYIYGLPAYNWTQVEASFNVRDVQVLDVDRVKLPNNNKYSTAGNEYYAKKTIPAYAHSWMLTGIVGPDYVDRTNDGISDDDFGYWVKFEYERKYSNYKWRAPYTNANYVEGVQIDGATPTKAGNDDMGSYLYGEKDVYYISKVSTKTHTAIFTVSDDRDDSKSAAGEFATTAGTDKLFRLDNIKLYTRADFDVNGAGAKPIKTVEFEYSNALCGGVENSSSGKLTLKKVFFKYNGSERGSLSPYVFDYEESSQLYNPVYNNNNIDRWGNYKHNLDASNDPVYPNSYPYHRYPYVNQWDYDGDGDEDYDDTEMRNAHASAWHLRKITLPTGGTIKIDYEQDDYAYVENKPAMQMFDIVGVGNNLTDPKLRGQTIFNANIGAHSKKHRIYVRLAEVVPDNGTYNGGLLSDPDVAAQYFRDRYLKDIQDIYFRTLVSMPNNGQPSSHKDYVSGYAKLSTPSGDPSDNYGMIKLSGSNYEYGYFDLAGEQVKVKQLLSNVWVHPFTKAGWYHARGSRPELLSATPPPHSEPLQQVIGFISSIADFIANDIPQLIAGFENYCLLKKFSTEIALNGNSIVRLHTPDGKKYGGGSRVKRITLSDEWAAMNTGSGAQDSKYGQEYDYTIEEGGRTISSGVAYEPSTGGEESALKTPIRYVNSQTFKTDENLFMETPIMEEFYPAPSVGYRKVTVKSLGRNYVHNTDYKQSDEVYAPYTVHEFYSPKDFPVIAHATHIDNDNTIKRPIPLPFYSQTVIRKAVAQGFAVILNDMAGKVKSVAKYTTPNPNATVKKQSNLLYKEEYVYKTTEGYDPSDNRKTYELDCKVPVVLPDGSYKPAYLGQSHDFYVELHEDFYITKTKGVDINFIGPFAIIPVLPIPIPSFSKGENSLKTAVSHKVIYKTGVVEKVIVTDEKARIETQNLAFDALTGQPVLTRINNEFKDNIYSLTQPAYWYYDGMGGAYRNIGYRVEGKTNTGNGWIALTTDEAAHFVIGDEVAVGNEVYNVYDKTSTSVRLIDVDGKFMTKLIVTSMEVTRSGRRNLIAAPAGSTTLQQVSFAPAGTGNLLSGISENNKIVNTSALVYSDNWQLLCGGVEEYSAETVTVCDYTTVVKNLFNNFINGVAIPDIANTATNTYELCLGGKFSITGLGVPEMACCNSTASILAFEVNGNMLNVVPFGGSSGCYRGCALMFAIQTGHNWTDVAEVSLPVLPNNFTYQNDFVAFAYRLNGQTNLFQGVMLKYQFGSGTCIPLYECKTMDLTQFDICPSDNYFNPYKHGAKGTWRPVKTYAYHHERDYSTENVRTDGHYKNFSPFNWLNLSLNDPKKWVCASTVTKISPYSYELENRDALGIYSSALYGYDNTLVTAIAANARYSEIASDGFEDYGFGLDPALCGSGHWDFRQVSGFVANHLTDEQAHTGFHSCKLTTAHPSVEAMSDAVPENYCSTYNPNTYVHADNTGYMGSACQCIGKHALIQGRKYVISSWVKSGAVPGYVFANQAAANMGVSATITYLSSAGQTISTENISIAVPHHVDGWSKLEGTFTVPANATKVLFGFQGSFGWISPGPYYLDDIRIQPFNSEMKTFVYHYRNLRLLAELDGQNYATYYLYDEEGNLVKVNKETVEGIRTLTEGRKHTVTTNPAP